MSVLSIVFKKSTKNQQSVNCHCMVSVYLVAYDYSLWHRRSSNSANRGEDMAQVLLFNIEKNKAIKIKMLCRKFFIETKDIPKKDFGCTISFLLGVSPDRGTTDSPDFSEEMLYLADINTGFLSVFLDQLRRQKITISLKAVKTDSNVHFTAYELYKELAAEREAIARGTSPHLT